MDASRRLNEMVANYGDVIPRRDYEQLQKQNEVNCIGSFPLLYKICCRMLLKHTLAYRHVVCAIALSLCLSTKMVKWIKLVCGTEAISHVSYTVF